MRDGPRCFRRDFSCPALLRMLSALASGFAYGVVTLFDLPFRIVPLPSSFASDSPSTPTVPKHSRFGLLRFRSPLPAQSLLFSFPAGTEMFQFPAFAFSLQRMILLLSIGLPHSDIRGSFGYLHLTPAFRSFHVLLRLREPRHPPSALVCLFYLIVE